MHAFIVREVNRKEAEVEHALSLPLDQQKKKMNTMALPMEESFY